MSKNVAAREQELIFDVGCHEGEDSDFYLKKGFKVIAVEANPTLCERLRVRFSQQIADGSFVLVDKAIAERSGDIEFFYDPHNSVWGTTMPKWARRNRILGSKSRPITVSSVTFESLLERFGVPHYLKIDIEGADLLCLKGLLPFSERPRYVSLESEKRSWLALREEMTLLRTLGYSKFQVVDQKREVPEQTPPSPPREGRYTDHHFEVGSSGLFGAELPGPWLTDPQALAKYRSIFVRYWLWGDFGIFKIALKLLGMRELRLRHSASWYDTHAMRHQ